MKNERKNNVQSPVSIPWPPVPKVKCCCVTCVTAMNPKDLLFVSDKNAVLDILEKKIRS